MDNPVGTNLPARLVAFENGGNGDEVATDMLMAEVTDSGEGFAEVAFNYGEERIYLAFRLSDFQRAVKDASNG